MNSQSEDIGFESSKSFEITIEIYHEFYGEGKPEIPDMQWTRMGKTISKLSYSER